MRVVVDATPLIALAIAGQLDLLHRIFGQVLVPSAVYEEVVVAGAERPGADLIAQAGWLRVVQPTAVPTIEPLLLGLDEGELEVLLLAREVQPDWVLIDERQARRVARAMGLPVKRTLGILLAATLAGLLSQEDARIALRTMVDGGIRVSRRWQRWLEDELSSLGAN